MRRRAKVDANHAEIVEAFRRCGWLVMSLAPMGRGVPDLLVQRRGLTCLVEVKGPKGELTAQQRDMAMNGWKFTIVRSVADVEINGL